MQIEGEHTERFRSAVGALAVIAEDEPSEAMVNAAYDAIGRVVRALSDLAPNHPGVMQHRSALAVPIGGNR